MFGLDVLMSRPDVLRVSHNRVDRVLPQSMCKGMYMTESLSRRVGYEAKGRAHMEKPTIEYVGLVVVAGKVSDVNGLQHQEELCKTAIGEVISSLSRYVDTTALLRPSHWCILGSFWHRSHTNPRSLLCSETFQSIVRMLLSASHRCKHLRKLTAVGDDDLGLGGTGGGTVGLDLLDDVHAVDDRAEDDVLAVQPRGLLSADEELGAVAMSC